MCGDVRWGVGLARFWDSICLVLRMEFRRAAFRYSSVIMLVCFLCRSLRRWGAAEGGANSGRKEGGGSKTERKQETTKEARSQGGETTRLKKGP